MRRLPRRRIAGLEVIVLDHHAVETNPPVLAHVNPNGPDDQSGLRGICCSGVEFSVSWWRCSAVCALQHWFAEQAIGEPDLIAQLDLVALATVADVVPLSG